MSLLIKLISIILRFLFYLICFMVVLVIIPQFPPNTNFSVIDIPPDLPLEGPLALNNALNNGQKLYEKQVVNPEDIEVYKGELYLSLGTGEIVKFAPGGPIQFVTKIGKPCSGLHQEHICGRPLGIRIDEKTEKLYLADAYYGLWKVDLRNGKKELLVSPIAEIEGKIPKFFNAIALADNGDIYWTITSSSFDLNECLLAFLSDPDGRLMHYSAATNTSTVLLENLFFANSLIISPDQQFILVAETVRKTIIKYYIDGAKKGESEMFISGLPGGPDNMKEAPDGSGGLISLASVPDPNDNKLRFAAKTPLLRKLISRLLYAIKLPLKYVNNVYPNDILEQIIYKIGHFSSIASVFKRRSAIVHFNWEGKIIATYYNNEDCMSDFAVYGDRLYYGNVYGQDFVGSYKAPAELVKMFANQESVMTENRKQ